MEQANQATNEVLAANIYELSSIVFFVETARQSRKEIGIAVSAREIFAAGPRCLSEASLR